MAAGETPSAGIQLAAAAETDLSELSIEELAQIPVRSASKREEPLSGAPTALYVLTGEEIAASAATSLPEALRLAPNLQVQQVDASQYAISARGFNGTETANKLLVLIDGRSVYSPLHSQVFWNLHSPLLEDIAQIEVISGPGGTLHGPNAVNGVVNVTSRDARDTVGTLIRASAGNWERTAALRHGLSVGGAGAVRFYGNWNDREDLERGTGAELDDAFRGWQAGFRADFGTGVDQLTVQGDVFDHEAETVEKDGVHGYNLLARWSRSLGDASSVRVQAYHDRFEREFLLVRDSLETFDVEGQWTGTIGRHELVAGAGLRTTRDEFINNLNEFQLDPTSRRLWVYNLFAQDRIRIAGNLSLIAGLKVEKSSFTDFQFLPNLRIAWQASDRHLLWAAVSRAVRNPSRIDRDLSAPILAPGREFKSEKLVALEAGYRGQPLPDTSLSVSGFVNFYDDLRTLELSDDGGLPLQLRNSLAGRSYGVEAWSRHQLARGWRLSLGAAAIWKDFHVKEGRVDLARTASLGNDPDWQLLARSEFDLAPRLSLWVDARLVDDIDRDPEIDGYFETSARLAYDLTDAVELYLAGRNLIHEAHAENNDPGQGQLPERSLLAGTRVRF